MNTTVVELGSKVAREIIKENSGREYSRQLQIVLRWYDMYKKEM